MIRTATILAASMALAACTTGRDELFLNMNEQELAAYNAELPERRQIVCAEGVRHGTADQKSLHQRSPNGQAHSALRRR
jgi:hypothetical protein